MIRIVNVIKLFVFLTDEDTEKARVFVPLALNFSIFAEWKMFPILGIGSEVPRLFIENHLPDAPLDQPYDFSTQL